MGKTAMKILSIKDEEFYEVKIREISLRKRAKLLYELNHSLTLSNSLTQSGGLTLFA